MASILDMLLGGGKAPAADPLSPVTVTPSQDPNATTNLGGVTSTFTPPSSAAAPASAPAPHHTSYDNNPELQAIQNVRSQYPDNQGAAQTTVGNLLGGHGTLRNILGTLGDAFLVQSGHQPVYAAAKQREAIAQAAAGFDTDPAAAAARVAATGAPGSTDFADKLYGQAESQKLRQAQQDSTNTYRQGLQQDRDQRIQDQQRDSQNRTDDRRRGIIGGLLQGAASSGDPQKYAAARAQALKIKGDSSGIDDSEIPQDINGYQTTYGMNANQVARNTTSNASIQERANSAATRNQTTIRGQNLGAGNNQARIAATERGQDMVDARAKNKSHLTIPGLNTGSGGGRPVPTAQDRAYLQAHPEKAAAFKAHFGTL